MLLLIIGAVIILIAACW